MTIMGMNWGDKGGEYAALEREASPMYDGECEDCGQEIPRTDRFCGPCSTMQDWGDGI